MKIAIFEPNFLTPKPNSNSALRILQEQVEILAKIGNTVMVLTESRENTDIIKKNNYFIYPLKGMGTFLKSVFSPTKEVISYFSGFFSPEIILSAVKILKRIKPDIIYSCGTSFSAFFSSLLSYFTGIPNVHYVFEYTGKWKWWKGDKDIFTGYKIPKTYLIEQFINTFIREIPRREIFQQWGLNHAKKIIVSSNYIKNKLIKQRINGEKISVIYPGVEIPDNLPLVGTDNLITYFGHLFQGRGVLDLLNAFGQISPEYPDFKLLLAFNNIHTLTKLYFEKLVEKYNLNSKIILKGIVKDIYTEVICPSLLVCLPYRDTPSIKLLETMAYGKPVLTTDVGWIPEVFKDGKEIFIVQKGDVNSLVNKLKSILGDIRLLREVGTKARLCIQERFNIKTNTEKIIEVLKGAL